MQTTTKLAAVTFYAFCFILLNSCINDKNYKSDILKPNADKEYGELLFALNKKYWSSKLGKNIEKEFEKLVKTTPLPFEKEFNIDFIVPEKVMKNIKRKNCLLFIDISQHNPKKSDPIIERDLWAKGQLVIELKFQSEKEAISYFKENANELKLLINEFYYTLISRQYTLKNNVNSILNDALSLKFKTPKEIKLNSKEDNFWWFSELTIKKDQNGPHEIQKGLVIYKYPYYDKSQFTKEYQIKKRDSIGEKHLKGKQNDSYMKTIVNDIYETSASSSLINKEYVFRLSGCWKMINDKMGGAFVSISRISNDKKHIITTEGYVYAPNFKKLKLLREQEALIYSSF
jgi:hypothetical protein